MKIINEEMLVSPYNQMQIIHSNGLLNKNRKSLKGKSLYLLMTQPFFHQLLKRHKEKHLRSSMH